MRSLILFLYFLPSIGFAETIDVSIHRRCDPVYNPANCIRSSSGSASMKDELARRVGIILPRVSNSMPDYELVTVTIDPSTGRTSVRPSSIDPSRINTQGDTPATPEQQAQKQQGGGMQGMGNQGAQQAGMQAPPVQIQNPGSGVTTVGGMMYADDEPELEKIEAPGTSSPGQMAMQMPAQAALAANQNLDTGNGSGSGGSGGRMPAAAGGGVGPNQFGQVDNSPNPTPSESGFGAGLRALASALGEGAMSVAASFGVDGGGPVGGSNGPGQGPNAKLASADNPNLQNGTNARLRNLLKDRYGRYISSSKTLEFGASDSFMFQGMCGHYAAYAAKNRIRSYHQSTCEEQ